MEEDLRASLRHVAVPEGFAKRVEARVEASVGADRSGTRDREDRAGEDRAGVRIGAKQMRGLPRRATAWMALAAALLLATGGTAVHLHRVQERQRAEAERQLTFAMVLTRHALAAVRQDVERSPAGRYTAILQDGANEREGR